MLSIFLVFYEHIYQLLAIHPLLYSYIHSPFNIYFILTSIPHSTFTLFTSDVNINVDFDKALEALKEDNSALRSILKTQGENIANLIQSNNSSQKNETLADELKKNMSVIEDIAKGLTKKELQISKANTIRTSITDNSESLRLLDIARLAHVKLSMYDVFSKIPVTSSNHNGVITYTDWDEATTVRAADMVAEGGLFPESTATWIEKKLELRKVGDTLPVSEEFYEDEARFASELDLFLQTNVDIKVDDQICNGDGTGQNLKGLIASSFSFSSTGLTTVPDASFYDLLAITPEMNIGYGSKYMFDVVFMNKKEINKMRLKKDANNNYIIPPFTSQNGKEVDGMVVMECNVMPDNECVLGDRRFGRIYEVPGVSVARNIVGDQFLRDLETIKIRRRLGFLVRESESRAFIHIGDIAAAISAITTP